MAYVEGTLQNADLFVSEVSALERPPGDEQRIETMLNYLAESSVAMRSAIDAYQRFGPQSPAFQENLNQAAELERKFDAAAKVYGMKVCG